MSSENEIQTDVKLIVFAGWKQTEGYRLRKDIIVPELDEGHNPLATTLFLITVSG